MKFKEHGVFEIKTEARLLLVDATGPFNEEVVKRFEKALESCIQQLEFSHRNQIITLHQLSLFPPGAEEIFTDTLIKRRSRGLLAGYVILEDVDFTSLVKEQLSRCYRIAGVKHHFFDSTSEAKERLTRFSSALPLTSFARV